jgi:ParB-like chromosome segregation protein Spo0J
VTTYVDVLLARAPAGTVPLSLIAQSDVRPGDVTVQRYAADMKRGDKFPPVHLKSTPRGWFTIEDGNHRVAAARFLGLEHIAAYINVPSVSYGRRKGAR